MNGFCTLAYGTWALAYPMAMLDRENVGIGTRRGYMAFAVYAFLGAFRSAITRYAVCVPDPSNGAANVR